MTSAADTIIEQAKALGASVEARQAVQAMQRETTLKARLAEATTATDDAIVALMKKTGFSLSTVGTLLGVEVRQNIHRRVNRHQKRTTTNMEETG